MRIISFGFGILFFLTAPLSSFAQTGQLSIGRVSQMPQNLPGPYMMRDWKTVAVRYDSFIYSLNSSGQYLPLMHLQSGGVNYPSLQPILLDSYVGSVSAGAQAEAINIIPSIVGASLVGVDKSNQNGTNWVLKAKEFFNKANGQNVYLNGYSVFSGFDWWYDVMPNVFFYQLYALYPNTQDFDAQFSSVADRWLAAVYAMGGSTTPWKLPQMNHRAFNLATMKPNDSDVPEPESAGTIAWLLYHAYLKTGEKKYLDGAQLAMGYLSGLNFNPAYEIQMPYGSSVAAEMNAELGTHYPVAKMIDWSFNQSSERNWGTIVGKWGDGSNIDVSGLIGEVDNPLTGYAFAMNGFEQAAAFVPMVKYDKRFARDIAKWALNVANASRLFYSQYLPQSNQDDFGWSSVNDPHSAIAYEALKQTANGKNLYGTGDAKSSGGQTNLGLYGSSHVGYLAAIVQPTDVDGVLLLDVNKTDFFGQNSFPSFLIYNPYASDQLVTIPLGSATYDIYDAISQTIIKTGATGNYQITVPSVQAMLLVYLPQGQGASTTAFQGKLFLGNKVVDYSYGYDFNGTLRIRSLASKDSLVEFNEQVPVYSSVENNSGPVTYHWYINGTLATSSPDSTFIWTVPSTAGQYKLLLIATAGIASAKDSLMFAVVSHINTPPVITGFTTDTTWYYVNNTASVLCHATNQDGGPLEYVWSVPGGAIISQNDSLLHWQVPSNEGLYPVSCTVKNSNNLTSTSQQQILVKITTQNVSSPVAYYPMDGDVMDYSGNEHNAAAIGVHPAADERGQPNDAFKFTEVSDIIDVPNATSLNFQNQITLSFWLELDAVPQESYVISHGSYQQRWKVSVIPNNKLRWTVKTATATTDLDSSFPLLLTHFYHFTTVYTGYSMELYVNGVLDTFEADSGLISTATDDITFGRETSSIQNYSLLGTLDEVRMYDKALGPNEIITLKTLWNSPTTVTGVIEEPGLEVYPNPSRGILTIKGIHEPVKNVLLIDMTGRKIDASCSYIEADGLLQIEFTAPATGIMIIKIEMASQVMYRKIIVSKE